MTTEPKKTEPSLLDEIRTDFPRLMSAIPDKGLFLVLLGVWSALFQFWGNSVFGWVDTSSLFGWTYFVHDTAAEDGIGKLIPFVVLALFWWKREELMAIPKGIWWPAIVLVLGALVIHIAGFMVQQTRVSIVAYFLGVYGLMGLIWGHQWLRSTFFPMFLFAFCVPFGTLSDPLTLPLRILVTKIAVGFSHGVLGISVVSDGTNILGREFMYNVAVACSGLRSLIALLIITIIYAFISFTPNWKRLAMIAASVPLALFGNVVRLTLVILIGDAFGHDAGAFVEQKLGFITFAIAIGSMLGIGYLLRDREDGGGNAARRVSMEANPA